MTMKLIIFIFSIASASAGSGKWSGMRVKYGPSEELSDSEYLWKVPRTLTEALEGRWMKVNIPNDLNVQFVGVSRRDYGFTPLYDANGFLGGAQLCQLSSALLSVGPPKFNPTASGSAELKTIGRTSYYCSTFLIVDPVTLRSGGRTDAASLGEGLWFRDTNDLTTGYRQIPTDLDKLLEETLYTQQTCVPGQGMHYFYNFTKDFDCHKLYSWYISGYGNDITAVGWENFGGKFIQTYNWYDFVLRDVAMMAAPTVNECMYDWTEKYHYISVHVFLVDDPWTITCDEGDSLITQSGDTPAEIIETRTLTATEKWDVMRVKYGTSESSVDNEYLWEVPRTLAEALAGRWQNVTVDNDLGCQYVGVSQNDFGFNPIYDASGYLAGGQICQPEAELTANFPPTYAPTDSGALERKTMNEIDYLCSTFLLINPTTVRSGGRTEFTSLGEGLWVREITDTETGYEKIPDNTTELLQSTAYTMQNCYYAMGRHYFYNFTTDMDCDNLYPWVILGQKEDMTGISWQLYGTKTVATYDWYDNLAMTAIQSMTATVNECLYEYIYEYSITSVHVFFKDESWNVVCGEGDSIETAEETAARVERLQREHNATTS